MVHNTFNQTITESMTAPCRTHIESFHFTTGIAMLIIRHHTKNNTIVIYRHQ